MREDYKWFLIGERTNPEIIRYISRVCNERRHDMDPNQLIIFIGKNETFH